MDNIDQLDKNKLTIIRVIILLMCAMLIPLSIIAQDIKAGVKGGLNFSNFASLENVEDQSMRTGFHAGVFAQLPILDGFAIQPEILYNTKGTRATYDAGIAEGDAHFNLSYIDIPVLAVFKLGESANIHIGPYVGFLLNSNIDADLVGEMNAEDSFKTLDFGLAGGFALDFEVLSIGTRYNLGLSNITEGAASDAILSEVRNSLAQVYLSLNLNH